MKNPSKAEELFKKKVLSYLHKKFPRYTDNLLIVDNNNEEIDNDDYNDYFFEMVDDLRNNTKEFKNDFKGIEEDYANGFVEDYMSNPNSARYYKSGKLITRKKKPAKKKVASLGRIITFDDGFQFREVTKDYARKNWRTQNVFAIREDEQTESLIIHPADIDDYPVVAVELGFRKTTKK